MGEGEAMMVGGFHMENITCPLCRFRHPREILCSMAAEIAATARAGRARIDAECACEPATVDNLIELLNEVRAACTRDDDLPDNLLPRIDAALASHGHGHGH